MKKPKTKDTSKETTKAVIKLPKWQNKIQRPKTGSKLAKVWKCLDNYYLPDQDLEVKNAWIIEAQELLNKGTSLEAFSNELRRYNRFHSIK